MTRQVSMVPVAMLAALEQAMNAALALDPDTLARLAPLEGRIIALDLRGTGLTLYLAPHARGFDLMGHFDGTPDVTLSGGPLALLRMGTGAPGEGMFSGDITIHGDVELGQKIQRILAGLDIDWEEHLSRLTGDVVAHQVGNAVRGLFAWGREAADALARDSGEYLQEERRVVPTRYEVEDFLAAVDTLRSDADRLAARVERLRQRLHEEG